MQETNKIDIAVGLSARSRTWKNQTWDWEKIREKLLTEHKTNETFKEFISSSRDEQLKIKDVGGYVGGYLKGGRRKPENVIYRQLLTLDLDNIKHSGFWEDFEMLYDNEAVLHATHKHSEKDPRYRLVMPLNRECTPDEYVAIARRIAGNLGIDYFDNTTFQSERLMFWPSSSKDVKYYAESQSGPWLDADEVLDTYTDWKDSSSWPTSEATIKSVHSATKKQEDPESKRGVIGAFCRSYTITEAIEEFLSDEYVDAGKGRFTYKKGSAAAGLVVYEDDKFAFSHHGTDPTGGKLCNAFDLVRIHKFGHLDSNSTTSNDKSKSFLAMQDFCTEDKNVKKLIAEERMNRVKEEFGTFDDDLLDEDDDEANEWLTRLDMNRNGEYLANDHNISLIFENDPNLKGAFKENSFSNSKFVTRTLPWRVIKKPEPMKNVDYSGVRNYFGRTYNISSAMKIEDALNIEFDKNSFHPIRDYLNGLKWDGQKRIDNLLIDYFGADKNIYSKEAIRKMLCGAVARIFDPGEKFDLVLTLTGEQGTGKSTFIKRLGREWFSDSFYTVNGKEAFEQLQGSWLIEMAELSGMRKSEVEPIKHFISKTEDTFRPAYGRIQETFKRQCVFFATTNENDFLRDPSGNRRFMPVSINTDRIKKSVLSDNELNKDQINQIWAEAVTLYRKGEKLCLSEQAEEIAKNKQKIHSQVDDRFGIVSNYLEMKLPENWDKLALDERRTYIHSPDDEQKEGTVLRESVSVAEIWCECLGKEKADMTQFNTRPINDILKGLEDWQNSGKSKRIPLYGKQRYFEHVLL